MNAKMQGKILLSGKRGNVACRQTCGGRSAGMRSKLRDGIHLYQYSRFLYSMEALKNRHVQSLLIALPPLVLVWFP
jgi:hypothetical protein